MGSIGITGTTSPTINELREFASFTPCEQRYIKRSLDTGLGRDDALRLWGRDASEAASIRKQCVIYQDLKPLRHMRPDEDRLDVYEDFIGKLVRVTAFDLGEGRIVSFSAYRFLYERLLGAKVRPWLPSAYCAASALPQVEPQRRKELLQSISEASATAPGWSVQEPTFYPEWVDQEAD